jgi:hypothetical protein
MELTCWISVKPLVQFCRRWASGRRSIDLNERMPAAFIFAAQATDASFVFGAGDRVTDQGFSSKSCQVAPAARISLSWARRPASCR